MKHMITLICYLILNGCTLNYPREDFHAELFLPMLTGFEDSDEQGDFEYTRASNAFRISKALELQYIATVLEGNQTSFDCSGQESQEQTPEEIRGDVFVRITRILQPFEWEPLLDNKGIYRDLPGGVLFGTGVRLSDASLLSLRYVLSPVNDPRYTWTSSGLTVDIPYRYIEFEEIALSDQIRDLFTEPMVIYQSAEEDADPMCPADDIETKCKPECHVCDDLEVVISLGSKPVVSGKRTRVPLVATKKTGIWLNDANSLSPVLYTFPQRKAKGWIDVINLSAFPGEGESEYMNIVRALTLAQAGDCSGAYTIYKEKIEKSKSKNKEQVLTIIAHLNGPTGDITAVLDDLAGLNKDKNKEKEELVANYRKMMKKN